MVSTPHVRQYHCYLDDVSTQGVALNVEIVDNGVSDNQPSVVKHEIKEEINRGVMTGIVTSETMNDAETSLKKSVIQTVYMTLSDSCMGHSELFLLEDEKLVKPGDKFESLVHFVQYLNENAKRWCYYYKCSDSRKPRVGTESYTYNCVYLKTKENYVKKGLRKRNNNTKTDCPCKIKVRHLPNEKELTVVYVCNHHDHELTEEGFNKLQHGRRLPPYLKEEIMDFIALQVDIRKIKKYVHLVTGFTMSRPFFYTIFRRMKNKNVARQITDKRLRELSEKLSVVDKITVDTDSSLAMDDHDSENMYDNLYNSEEGNSPLDPSKERKVRKYKRRPKNPNETEIDEKSKKMKQEEETENVEAESETLQSVKNLQESVKCEAQTNPWVSDQCVPVLSNGDLTIEYDEATNEIIEYKIVQDPNDTNGTENIQYTVRYCDDNNGFVICEKSENEDSFILNESNGQIEQNNYILNESNGQIENSSFILNESNGQSVHTTYILNEQTGQIEIKNGGNENYIAYSTVVSEAGCVNEHTMKEECHIVEQSDSSEYSTYIKKENHGYAINEQCISEGVEFNEDNSRLEQSEIMNDTDQTTEYEDYTMNDTTMTNDFHDTQTTTEYNDSTMKSEQNIDGYDEEMISNEKSCDAAVQTYEKVKSGHSVMPVFRVLMKDDNITGFVLKDKTTHELKGNDKEVQTEGQNSRDLTDAKQENIEIKSKEDCVLRISDKVYTKDEYIHKYNIDRYMTQPYFPKYIQTLSKETFLDTLNMFTSIYKEKAMFKMTTTQKGKSGNTKIWYIRDKHLVRKISRRSVSEDQNRIDENEVLVLKEKIKSLKKRNNEIAMKNKYLEDIVSKLVTQNITSIEHTKNDD